MAGERFGLRQLRVRVLEALEERIKQFRPREELWPLRVPGDPVPLDAIVQRAIPEDRFRFDPLSLRSRTLLACEWEDGSRWEAWVTVLPSGFKVYCDWIEEETRLLASGGRNEGDESDRIFLELLSESGGRHFGIEMSGGAPTRVRSSVADREFLIEMFVNLFEVTGTEDSVRERLAERPGAVARHADFRADVELWLDRATTETPAPAPGTGRTPSRR
jgi:hypothetical protein